MLLYKSFAINGPVQIVRLEGKINNIKKVIYIFGDLHLDVNVQSECINDASLDVDKFLKLAFLDIKDKKLDFFVEVQKDDKLPEQRKMKYLFQLRKFVTKYFSEKINDRVKTSEKYNNVRFHYFEMRGLIWDFIYMIFELEDFLGNPNYYKIYEIDKQMKDIINQIDYVMNILEKDNNIAKIKYRYKNKSVQKKINEYFDINKKMINDMSIKFTNISKLLDKIIEKIPKFMNEPSHIFHENIIIPVIKIYDNNENFLTLSTILLTDLYLLRRILDKDYITNALVYTGYHHLLDLSYILIKDFDFKITHIDKSNKKVDEINKLIKNMKSQNFLELNRIFSFSRNLPNELQYQCSTLDGFPENFD